MTASNDTAETSRVQSNQTVFFGALAFVIVALSLPDPEVLAWLEGRATALSPGVISLALLSLPVALVFVLDAGLRAHARAGRRFAVMANDFLPGIAFSVSVITLTKPFGRVAPLIERVTGPLSEPTLFEIFGLAISLLILIVAVSFAYTLALQPRLPAERIADEDETALGPRDRRATRLSMIACFGEALTLLLVVLLHMGEGGSLIANAVLAVAAALCALTALGAHVLNDRLTDEFERAESTRLAMRSFGVAFYALLACILVSEIAPQMQITGFDAFIVIYGGATSTGVVAIIARSVKENLAKSGAAA
ncbi:MAG: hypothetical protein ACFB2Z_12715 [Maricaulaceae bacterium]